jgi:hypothetical protein
LIFFVSCALIDLLLMFGPSFQLYIELTKHNKTPIYQNITICICESYNNFIIEVSDLVMLIHHLQKCKKTLIDKNLASLWQPIVQCQHTRLQTQNNYFDCCRWINFSLIWHLKHLMEKLLLNENVLSSTYNWIHSFWCWVHVQKIVKEWNSQISPSNLEESFTTNNLGPSKFHKSNNNPLQDFLDFLHSHGIGLLMMW